MAKEDKEILYLEIEKSRINREKSKAVLDKSFMLYFSFLLVGIVGFAGGFVESLVLKALVIAGIVILILGTIPYVIITTKEDKFIKERLEKLRK